MFGGPLKRRENPNFWLYLESRTAMAHCFLAWDVPRHIFFFARTLHLAEWISNQRGPDGNAHGKHGRHCHIVLTDPPKPTTSLKRRRRRRIARRKFWTHRFLRFVLDRTLNLLRVIWVGKWRFCECPARKRSSQDLSTVVSLNGFIMFDRG